MSKSNALYWQDVAIDGALDLIAEDGGDPVSGLSRDLSGFNFTVKGDAEYRIEVRAFELKEDK